MGKFTDVRTKSIPTATALLVLGHEPLEILRDDFGAPVIRFALTAESDLRRYLAAKQKIEHIVTAASNAQP